MFLNRRIIKVGLVITLAAFAVRLSPVRAQDNGEDEAMRIFDMARDLYYENVDGASYTAWVNGDMGNEQSGRPDNLETGEHIPDFKFKRFNTEGQIASTGLKGPYILNFWASWCPPCRDEFPRLADSIENGDLKIPIYFVNVFDKKTDAQRFLYAMAPKAKLTLVTDDDKSTFANKYGLNAIPQTILVDADGNIQAIHSGGMSNTSIRFFVEIAGHPGVGAFDSNDPDLPPENMPGETTKAEQSRSQ